MILIVLSFSWRLAVMVAKVKKAHFTTCVHPLFFLTDLSVLVRGLEHACLARSLGSLFVLAQVTGEICYGVPKPRR